MQEIEALKLGVGLLQSQVLHISDLSPDKKGMTLGHWQLQTAAWWHIQWLPCGLKVNPVGLGHFFFPGPLLLNKPCVFSKFNAEFLNHCVDSGVYKWSIFLKEVVARPALPCERVLSWGSCDRFGRCGNHMSEVTITYCAWRSWTAPKWLHTLLD